MILPLLRGVMYVGTAVVAACLVWVLALGEWDQLLIVSLCLLACLIQVALVRWGTA